MHTTKELHDYERSSRHSFDHMLRSALRDAGFTLVPHRADTITTAQLDICVTVSVKGAATSLVDATYEVYTADLPPDLMTKLGKTIYMISCESIEPVELTSPVAPMKWMFRGVRLSQGIGTERNIQTTYLAMQGIYPDLPPFSQLTIDQKKTIINHVDMLADHLRK